MGLRAQITQPILLRKNSKDLQQKGTCTGDHYYIILYTKTIGYSMCICIFNDFIIGEQAYV
jgi:hypothetical protein